MALVYPVAPAPATPWRQLVRAAAMAGTVAAVVEMVPVLGIQAAALGVSPGRIFQSIASGLFGAAAYRGGIGSALAGVALHWLISAGAALLFGWTATRWADLTRRAVLAGLAFGVLTFAAMTAIVVPFSAAAFRPNHDRVLMLVSLAVHVFFFGLPIALVMRRQLSRMR